MGKARTSKVSEENVNSEKAYDGEISEVSVERLRAVLASDLTT
jgi:hypothetical protein